MTAPSILQQYGQYNGLMIKKLCKGLINCITGLFKTQQDSYHEKLIELEQRIREEKVTNVRVDQSMVGCLDNQQDGHDEHLINQLQQNETHQCHPVANNDRQHFIKNMSQTQLKRIDSGLRMTKSVSHTIQAKKVRQKVGQNVPEKQKQRSSNRSSDSFHTLQSGSGSNQSISRRTFRSAKSNRFSICSGKLFVKDGNDQFKSITNRHSFTDRNMQVNASNQDISGLKLAEIMIQWNRKEYLTWQVDDTQNRKPNKLQSQNSSANSSKYGTEQQRNASQSSNQGDQKTQSEYDYKPVNGHHISTILLQKLRKNCILDQIINKIQDYYTFHDNEQFKQVSSQTHNTEIMEKVSKNKCYYHNKRTGLKCSYHQQSQSMSVTPKMLQLITFKCNTTNLISILQWYNSVETRAKLFDFHKNYLVENGIYPIVEVEQYSRYYASKNKYRMIRQTEFGNFEGETEKEFVLQMETSIAQNSQTSDRGMDYQHLLRFEIIENGLVQIYIQSNQKINQGLHSLYFKQRWISIEQSLRSQGILKEYIPVIQH